jgi:hypothetical protein
VRQWVRLYTRGLPAEAIERRRDEIEADLADEASDATFDGLAISRIRWQRATRLVGGIPADVAWRFETARDARSGRSDHMHASRRDVAWALLGTMLGLVFVWGGLTTSVQPNWQAAREFGLLIAFAGGLGVVASLVTLVRPVLGGRATVASAVGLTLAWMLVMPWAWFVMLPATIPLGWVGARRFRRPAAPVAT